jgi:hypothetical protein
MMKHSQVLALFAAVPLMLAGCGGSEQEGLEPGSAQPEQQLQSANPSQEEGSVHAQACFTTTEGSPSSCKSYDAWKLYTVSYCQSLGYTAAATNVSVPCGTNVYRYAAMTCC